MDHQVVSERIAHFVHKTQQTCWECMSVDFDKEYIMAPVQTLINWIKGNHDRLDSDKELLETDYLEDLDSWC